MSSDARRVQIVESAARVIVEHGIGGFRIRDVADAAGVSQPLVSAYFRSRGELVLAAFILSDDRALAAIARKSSAATTGRDALMIEMLACIDDGGDLAVAEGFRMWQEVWTHGFSVPELREAVQQREHVWVQRLAQLLRDAVTDGTAAPDLDVEFAAVMLNAMVDGLAPAVRWGYVDVPNATAIIRQAVDDRLAN